MLRLGLIIGGIVGALIATVLANPREDDETIRKLAEGPEPENLVDKVKLQVHEAQVAAQAEMKAKEAEMLAEYEAARRQAHSA